MNNPSPIFVTGAARSGTTLLFALLATSPGLWSLYREEHPIFEWDLGLHPDLDGDRGNVLGQSDATPARVETIRDYYGRRLKNYELFGASHRDTSVMKALAGMSSAAFRPLVPNATFVDKNPKHVYRVPFLRTTFPDSRFIFIRRKPAENIHSLYEAWLSQTFRTYGVLVNDTETGRELHWSFELPPHWREWLGRGVLAICAFQYFAANRALDAALRKLDERSFAVVQFEEFLENPVEVTDELCRRLGIRSSGRMEAMLAHLPQVNSVSPPNPEKWRSIEDRLHEIADRYPELGLRERLRWD